MVRIGQKVWIPCDVKPGAFSDERLVRIESESGSWLGFVPTWSLQNPIEKGETKILATVTEVKGTYIRLMLPGHPVTPGPFEDTISRAESVATT